MNRRRSRGIGPRRPGERGDVLVLGAIVMTALLLSSAMAVDFGFFYVRSAEIQRAADAAAMAGVVWMPDNFAQAQTVALASAAQNGFSSGVTVSEVSESDRRLKVTIVDNAVPRYFSSAFAAGKMKITRTAVAEYAPTLALGSPDNRFGNDPLSTPPLVQNLWSSISGPYTDLVNGDPYSTKCSSGSGTACTQSNGLYRTTGYKYAISVPSTAVGRTLTVEVYDAGNYARANYANVETADNGTVNTTFEMFDINPDPANAATDFDSSLSLKGSCGGTTPGKFYIPSESDSATYKNKWATLCTVSVTQPGVYHLQIKSSNLTDMSGSSVSDSGNGWNQFSLKTTISGTGVIAPIYGVEDLSIFNNLPGLSGTFNATFYFAKLENIYAGRHLTARLYDPGDGQSGTYYVNFLKPDGTTTSCKYGATGGTKTTTTNCRIQTRASGSNTYNGKWLDIDVDIPLSYSCSTDCWWKVKYEFQSVSSGSSPNDRTVWTAYVVGNPVHLVQ